MQIFKWHNSNVISSTTTCQHIFHVHTIGNAHHCGLIRLSDNDWQAIKAVIVLQLGQIEIKLLRKHRRPTKTMGHTSFMRFAPGPLLSHHVHTHLYNSLQVRTPGQVLLVTQQLPHIQFFRLSHRNDFLPCNQWACGARLPGGSTLRSMVSGQRDRAQPDKMARTCLLIQASVLYSSVSV